MSTKTLSKAKVLTPRELENYRYPLPQAWIDAVGILKGKKINALKYQRQIRKEWRKRMSRLERLIK